METLKIPAKGEHDDTSFSVDVGQRLRMVRRSRRWSLDDVERISGGRWSASAIGAYERGYRNLSLPRLQELAQFFGVTMSYLLGEPDAGRLNHQRIVLDLVALAGRPETESLARFVRAIRKDRGDHTATVLSLRRDDVRALCTLIGGEEDTLVDQLQEWGVLAASPAA
ncbi:MAG TPA: transcriptional regulator [Acidimicrobiales bacterium]|jgi:transcriptional regulator with XRE-family HTH domain